MTSSPSERFRIELTGPRDAAQLNDIYTSDDGFSGEIAVKYHRSPDPRASLLAEGDDVVIPAVRETASGRLVGMGACVTRQAWVNGEKVKVGYLTGLKALPEYRRGVPLIPQVYAFLRAQTSDVGCYYTTILSENTLARRLLERDRPNMPQYRPVADYLTHCFRPSGSRRRPVGRLGTWTALELGCLGGASRFNLAGTPKVADHQVRVLRDREGMALAWAAVLDQRATKQYVITSYGGRYGQLAKLPVHLAGYPRLPKPGVAANYVSIAGLGARDDDPGLVRELLRAIGTQNRDRDFIMLGLAGEHRFTEALAGWRTISYSSQLYTVHFDDDCLGLDERPIGLDVGLL